MKISRRLLLVRAASALTAPSFGACAKDYLVRVGTNASPELVDRLFKHTKLMCFGRYAVELPHEADQVLGGEEIAGGFDVHPIVKVGGVENYLRQRWKKITEFRPWRQMDGAIVDGGVPGSKYFWYWGDSYGRAHGEKWLEAAIQVGSNIYGYGGLTSEHEKRPPDLLITNMTALMRGMRAWDGVEVPREPGVCIDGAFIHEPTHRFQEIMSSGFYFPSLPDVSFSVLSNKNASVGGDNGKGLLEMVDEARREQPIYPYTFLRRGKRTLHGLWDGEEVLARRSDGALMFDWELVGEPGNVARPSWFEMGLRTKVADNKVGASPTTSLTDDEAVALWDRLLEGVKFRVAVPGATPQSVARL